MDEFTPRVGHNSQPAEPVDLDLILDPDVLADQFSQDQRARVKLRDELLARAKRFFERFETIETAEVSAEATSFAKDMKDLSSEIERERDKAGRVFLNATRAVNKFFKADFKDVLDDAVRKVEARISAYTRVTLERERAAAVAAAARLKEEAEAAAKAAEASMQPAHLDAALATSEAADAAHRRATGSASDLARTRGSTGRGVAAVSEPWVFEVVDFALVPDRLKVLNTADTRAEINAGARDIPGLRIYRDVVARVR